MGDTDLEPCPGSSPIVGNRSPRLPVLALAALLLGYCLACDGNPTGQQPVCSDEFVVEPGDIVGGRLQADDRRLAGAYIDYFALQLADAPDTLIVSVSSVELDPLLLVFVETADTMAQFQAFDSIGQPPGTEETASWVKPGDFPLPAGCHLIGASSWFPDATGAYTLTVDTTTSLLE